MTRAFRILAAGLMLAAFAAPQDLLPKEVVLLSRIKRHVKEQLSHLPNVSCLETVHRDLQPPGGKLHPLDTVRLEVLTNGTKELYASPGARHFSEQHPVSYTGSGVIGDGYFGLFLADIVVTGSVSYEYKGEEDLDGRRLVRYDFRLPLSASGYNIHLPEGGGRVGLHGSFWADPQTFDVIRLVMIAEDFPLTLPLTEAVTMINYTPTAVGENLVVLLPEGGDFRMTRFSGEVSHNRIEFTHCRLFGAQSTISFGAPGAPSDEPARFGVASTDDTLRPLPPGLQIAVKLNSRITEDMTVGTTIQGTVAGNVPSKGTPVIPAGARVRGRIRRLEKGISPVPHFVLALEFTEVEIEGIRHRFYADLTELGEAVGVERVLSTGLKQETVNYTGGGGYIKQSGETWRLPDLPGVAGFFVRGTKLDLPAGFRTVWKTLPLTP
jgi:hypothetical protein